MPRRAGDHAPIVMPHPPRTARSCCTRGPCALGALQLSQLKALLSGPPGGHYPIVVCSGTRRISLAGTVYSGTFPRSEVTY